MGYSMAIAQLSTSGPQGVRAAEIIRHSPPRHVHCSALKRFNHFVLIFGTQVRKAWRAAYLVAFIAFGCAFRAPVTNHLPKCAPHFIHIHAWLPKTTNSQFFFIFRRLKSG
jgi:hypothetical protein